MTRMRTLLIVVVLGFVVVRPAPGQAPIYPGQGWARVPSIEQAGWSEDKLKAARAYASTINTDAVMIVAGGLVLDEWGKTATRFNVHSVRKSFLSALYGIHAPDFAQRAKLIVDMTKSPIPA